MTTIVTMTMKDDRIKQVVTDEDPVQVYESLERLVQCNQVKVYSILTLKSHNSPIAGR
jgi:hypothetical protein